MLRTKQNRHTLAFILTALSSTFLYVAAQSGSDILIGSLLGLLLFAALLTLFTS